MTIVWKHFSKCVWIALMVDMENSNLLQKSQGKCLFVQIIVLYGVVYCDIKYRFSWFAHVVHSTLGGNSASVKTSATASQWIQNRLGRGH